MNPQILTERFEMRLGQSDLNELDTWRRQQVDVPSRSEAMRRLMEQGLASKGKQDDPSEIGFGSGEKLILLMLCDLFKKMKLKSDIEPEFVEEVIYGGHYWALDWKYPGIFHGYKDSLAILNDTVNILDMWSFLEDGYSKLSKKEKDRVAAEAEPLGKHVFFSGFDGNGEAEYIGIARFLVEKLDRFTKFAGRELNAHMPTVEAYLRMLAVFEPIRGGMVGRDLKADEIIEIVTAMLHPSRRKG